MLITPGCYPDPRNDHAFRLIFGDPRRAHVLRSLLNSLLRLRGEQAVTTLSIADPHQVPRLNGLKETTLDVYCKDQKQHEFIVEMQMVDKRDFEHRALYYVSKAYTNQLKSGDKYITLRPVTMLAVLDFQFLKSSDYLGTHLILDAVTGEHRLKDFGFTFLELPKFTKTEDELATMEEKWAYFFKHAGQTPIRRIPSSLRAAPEIEEAFAVLEELGLDDLQRRLFEKAEMDRMDRSAEIDKGYDDGHKKGLMEGREEGREEGRKEGIELTAARMLKEGMDNATVARVTGLSQQRIERLSRQED